MYAVIATGGKQYRVSKDGVLRVEKLDAEPGSTVEFGEVLLVGEGADVKVGTPLLKGSKVVATVVRHGPGRRSPAHLPAHARGPGAASGDGWARACSSGPRLAFTFLPSLCALGALCGEPLDDRTDEGADIAGHQPRLCV